MFAMENRRHILMMLAAGGLPLAGAAEASRLPNAVVDASKAKVTHESFGDLRIFFEGPTAQLKMMTAGSLLLKPGQEPHPPHQHPEEEFMVITEGNGEFLVDGKKVHAGPGSMLYCEGNQIHGVKNTGAQPLLFYFYKWLA
jgi:quercetin dioxygenase-like cupin family protein